MERKKDVEADRGRAEQVRMAQALNKHIAVIHGPNLNMLGKREVGIYGGQTMEDINRAVAAEAGKLNVTVEFYQSNTEAVSYTHLTLPTN